MPYTSDDLVVEVRRRSRLPSATDLSDAEILQYADQEMQTSIADVLRNANASFWVATHAVGVVGGVAIYDIPRRAIGAGLERVELEDGNGFRSQVVPVSEGDTWRWASGGRDPHWPGQYAFTLEGETLRLWPTPTSSNSTLRIRYQRQPSQLDPVASCAAIYEADTTVEISVASGNEALELLTTGSVLDTEDSDSLITESGVLIITEDGEDVPRYVDIVRGDGVHDVIAADRLMVSYVGETVTLDAATPIVVADVATSRSSTGGRVDYLCRAGFTCYPQIPVTLWPLLVSKTTVAVLEALGDREGMAAAQATANARETAARSIVTPRSRELPRFINRTSYLRRN